MDPNSIMYWLFTHLIFYIANLRMSFTSCDLWINRQSCAAHSDQSEANRHNFQSAHHSRRNATSILTETQTHIYAPYKRPPTVGARAHFQRVHPPASSLFCVGLCLHLFFWYAYTKSAKSFAYTKPFSYIKHGLGNSLGKARTDARPSWVSLMGCETRGCCSIPLMEAYLRVLLSPLVNRICVRVTCAQSRMCGSNSSKRIGRRASLLRPIFPIPN